MNLWWEVDVGTRSASEEDTVSASVLAEGVGGASQSNKGTGGTSSVPDGVCENAADDIGLFVGTIALFSAIFLGILLVHVAAVSAVEAYWLAKVRRNNSPGVIWTRIHPHRTQAVCQQTRQWSIGDPTGPWAKKALY